jgi:hypothetical protein
MHLGIILTQAAGQSLPDYVRAGDPSILRPIYDERSGFSPFAAQKL